MRITIFITIFLLSISYANAQIQQQLWGIFDSKKGVKHELSCYGYNIGYFQLYSTEESETVVINFDRMKGGEDVSINCEDKSITVWGYYETVEITPSKGNSCAGGQMTIFFVTKWECYN